MVNAKVVGNTSSQFLDAGIVLPNVNILRTSYNNMGFGHTGETRFNFGVLDFDGSANRVTKGDGILSGTVIEVVDQCAVSARGSNKE